MRFVNVAWLFPGQGSQKVGMGKALYESSPRAREIFERADQALGRPLSRLILEGPEDELVLTANAQPAILTTSIAALRALEAVNGRLETPLCAAGHSLGEYSALVAAEALSFEDAVRVVQLRGRAMQEAVPAGQGAMAAIMGGSLEAVEQLCADAAAGQVCAPANFNCPGQIVIAGDTDAVGRASNLAKERGLKAIPLKVSAPFHCSLMRPAARAVADALKDISINQPRFPVISNFEAEPSQDPEAIRRLLVRQVDGPVRWEQSVRWMSEHGVERALAFGPANALVGLGRKIDKNLALTVVSEPASLALTGGPAATSNAASGG